MSSTVLYAQDRLIVDDNGDPARSIAAPIFADAANTTPATISLTSGGAPVAGGVLLTDPSGYLPPFYGDGTVLWGPIDAAGQAGQIRPVPAQPLQVVSGIVLPPAAANGALVVGWHNPIDATTGNRTVTLPTGAAQGDVCFVEKYDASTNTVAITGNIRDVAGATITLNLSHETLGFIADATGSWWPVADHKVKSTLDAIYGKLAVLSDTSLAGIADGQLVAWNATAGKFQPATPSGNAQVAYAENPTGTPQTIAAGGNADVNLCTISVNPSGGRPVWITGRIVGLSTSAAAGVLEALLYETTGARTLIDGGAATSRPVNGDTAIASFAIPLGAVAAQRTFVLNATCAATGSACGYQIQNSAIFRSWLAAEVR